MIHNISTTEFIAAVKGGSYNENDVQRYCNTQPSLMPLFKSLLKAASTLIASKGTQGGFVWNLTERRWDFDNAEDLHLYMDAEFTRLQNAMGIVCDLIEKHPLQEQPKELQLTEGQKVMFERAINAGYMQPTENGYKWTYGGERGKARLAYFIKQVFNPDGCSAIPYKRLEAMFGITRLDSALDNALQAKKPQQWRNTIDAILR